MKDQVDYKNLIEFLQTLESTIRGLTKFAKDRGYKPMHLINTGNLGELIAAELFNTFKGFAGDDLLNRDEVKINVMLRSAPQWAIHTNPIMYEKIKTGVEFNFVLIEAQLMLEGLIQGRIRTFVAPISENSEFANTFLSWHEASLSRSEVREEKKGQASPISLIEYRNDMMKYRPYGTSLDPAILKFTEIEELREIEGKWVVL